jgi:hypothetical protein
MLPLVLMLALSEAPPTPAPPEEEPATFMVSLGAVAGAQIFDFSGTTTTRKLAFVGGARAGLIMRLSERLSVMPSLNFRIDTGSLRMEWTGQGNLITRVGPFLVIAGLGYGPNARPGERPGAVAELRAGVGMVLGSILFTLDAEVRFRIPEGGRAMCFTLTASWELPVRR